MYFKSQLKAEKYVPTSYLFSGKPCRCACLRHGECSDFFSPGLGHVSACEGIMVAALDMISYLRS